MQSRWTEALSSINEYAKGLKNPSQDFRITVATFDTSTIPSYGIGNHIPPTTTFGSTNTTIRSPSFPKMQNASTFDIIRDNVSANEWNNITDKEVQPRGGTPLFDATAKLVNLARSQNPDRAVLVIMTDGEENASMEIRDANTAKLMLDECRNKNWQIVFLGADFNNVKQAASMGTSYASTMSASGGVGLANATRTTARYAKAYGASGQSMSFNATDRLQASSSISNEDDLDYNDLATSTSSTSSAK